MLHFYFQIVLTITFLLLISMFLTLLLLQRQLFTATITTSLWFQPHVAYKIEFEVYSANNPKLSANQSQATTLTRFVNLLLRRQTYVCVNASDYSPWKLRIGTDRRHKRVLSGLCWCPPHAQVSPRCQSVQIPSQLVGSKKIIVMKKIPQLTKELF